MNYKKIIEKYRKHLPKTLKILLNFQDIKFSGQMIFIVIVLITTWSGVKSIQLNYNLQQQILKLKEEVKIQKIENQNVALENQYYSSKQYLELSARQNFGLGAAGETEVIVPKNVALKYVINPPFKVKSITKKYVNIPTWQKNLKNWFNFFLHK